jgi:hypothetical protein
MPEVALIESPTNPRLSENLPITILSTNSEGAKGRKLNFFCRLFMTMAMVSEKKRKKRMRASVVIYPYIMCKILIKYASDSY